LIKAYRKGADKERRIVRSAKDAGYLAFRSAGSHSPIDCCIIDRKKRKIWLIQAKSDSFPDSAKRRLLKEFEDLNGVFLVRFEVK